MSFSISHSSLEYGRKTNRQGAESRRRRAKSRNRSVLKHLFAASRLGGREVMLALGGQSSGSIPMKNEKWEMGNRLSSVPQSFAAGLPISYTLIPKICAPTASPQRWQPRRKRPASVLLKRRYPFYVRTSERPNHPPRRRNSP